MSPKQDIGCTSGKPCCWVHTKQQVNSCPNLPSCFQVGTKLPTEIYVQRGSVLKGMLTWGICLCIVSALHIRENMTEIDLNSKCSCYLSLYKWCSEKLQTKQEKLSTLLLLQQHSVSPFPQPMARAFPFLCVLSTRNLSTAFSCLIEELPAFISASTSAYIKKTIRNQEAVIKSSLRRTHKSLTTAYDYLRWGMTKKNQP